MRAPILVCMFAGLGLGLLPDAGVKAQAPHQRPPTRIRVYPYYHPDDVYPRYNPGPDAVRECNVVYAREYRPSGTVIVPHMSCHWRRG